MAQMTERRRWMRAPSDLDVMEARHAGADLTRSDHDGTHRDWSPRETQSPKDMVVDRPGHRTATRVSFSALDVPPVEPLLLTTVQVATLQRNSVLRRALGFFFRNDRRLFLVTSRHVLFDPGSGHLPDAIEIDVHTSASNLALSTPVRLPLYAGGLGLWRQGRDGGGDVDVAVLEVERHMLPPTAVLHAFGPEHLLSPFTVAEAGLPVLLVGFPLGFHDTLHHLPVVRHAIIASAFGLRFQGQGCFLTDGRAHRGCSGAPVVMRAAAAGATMPWRLLGVHSSRFDMGGRDMEKDESLGLNSAWYGDILMTLTASASPGR